MVLLKVAQRQQVRKSNAISKPQCNTWTKQRIQIQYRLLYSNYPAVYPNTHLDKIAHRKNHTRIMLQHK